jgi:hypothetical protein
MNSRSHYKTTNNMLDGQPRASVHFRFQVPRRCFLSSSGYSILPGNLSSWVVFIGQHVLSQASIAWPWYARGTRAPPHHEGTKVLFSRPLKESHKSFFHTYRSRSLMLRCWWAVLVLHAGELPVPARYAPSLLLLTSVHRIILVHFWSARPWWCGVRPIRARLIQVIVMLVQPAIV